VGRDTPLGPAPRRLTPIFRDRDELPASGDLGVELRAALARSLRLLVVCSPAAARSPWVNEEILAFKRLYGESGVLALIAAGEPNATAQGRPDEECFPPALRHRIGPKGALTSETAHPIAADMRPQGDGQRGALLKLIAGLAGLPLDELVQRETQRRFQNLSMLAAASMAGMALTGSLALYANERRVEADHQRQVAERETAAARAASDFLVGTFALSNPATESPRTITALTILRRGAERARTELADQPTIQIRLMETMGRAYNNLGLLQEAKADLEASKPVAHRAGPDGADALLTLATTYLNLGDLDAAKADVAEAERLLGPDLGRDPERRGHAAEVLGRIEAVAVQDPAADRDDERAIAFYRRTPNLKPQTMARIYLNHGLVLAEMGRHDDARRSELEAARIFTEKLGPRDLLTGQTYYALADNEEGAGRLDDALVEIRTAIGILSGVLENDNPILAYAVSKRGQIFLDRNQAVEARTDLKQALEIFQRAYKKPHYNIGITEVYLALAESKLGHTDEALRDLDLAKVQYDASYGHLHVNHGDRLVNRAVVLNRAGRTAEARHDCAAGLDILGKLLKPDEAFYKSNVAICAKI
jgi:tetratricopeptide (TPR) repeat protein